MWRPVGGVGSRKGGKNLECTRNKSHTLVTEKGKEV